MKRMFAIGLAALLAAAAEPPKDVRALGWMSGVWVNEEKGRWTEERWSPPRGGIMLGASRSGSGDKVREFEFMRLAPGPDGTVIYFASPGGREAVSFRLVSASPNEAVFENPEHDYPTRISYRREGRWLAATISGPDGRDAVSWRLRRR